ncbi:C40 family peptidase [Dactylosporangium darangshiense]|uniref:C40 family peptidase n=1 Tax=Dactylosporangium darangshiense TaxID=579108 RepID=A0ABP8DG54_9ACTN
MRTLLIGLVSLTVLAPATVAHADPSLSEIEAQLDKSSQELEATVESWNHVNDELTSTQAKAADLQTKLKPLEDGVAATGANVEQFAIAQFKTAGNMRGLSLMLNASSSGDLVDQLSMLQQITHSQNAEIAGYKAARSKYDGEKKALDETLAAVTAQKTQLETQRQKIEGDIKKLQDLKNRATAAGSTKVNGSGVTNAKAPVIDDATRQKVVDFAYAQLGKPYLWGAAGPSKYDCSGLTMAAWKQVGVNLPHNAADQYRTVVHISASQLLPGDLIFFYSGISHVGMYTKPGKMVDAPTTGKWVEEVSYAGRPIVGYGRPKF